MQNLHFIIDQMLESVCDEEGVDSHDYEQVVLTVDRILKYNIHFST